MTTQLQLGLDLERAVAARIAQVLAGKNCPWPIDWLQQEILKLLRERVGRSQALSISKIVSAVDYSENDPVPHWNEREVKAAVKSLVEDFGIPIGASRRPPYGYFLIATREDLEHALSPLRGELRSLSRRYRALAGKKILAAVFGQIQLELDRDAPKEAA